MNGTWRPQRPAAGGHCQAAVEAVLLPKPDENASSRPGCVLLPNKSPRGLGLTRQTLLPRLCGAGIPAAQLAGPGLESGDTGQG